MRKRQVWQYQCEFCGKRNLSGGHMKTHELHCTMNPNRECRVCALLEQTPLKASDLAALLPDHNLFRHEEDYGNGCKGFWYDDALAYQVNIALPTLRAACGDCPACILAALRQARIPLSRWRDTLVGGKPPLDFDFKKEMQTLLADVAAENIAREDRIPWDYGCF